ncbi:hypothetical protein SAMN05720766_12417 [Fibrobacter sp. UWH9]|nr:hypothetical protein SAMN05720766_12417 [Fibrobacter sp. UWH9]
MRALAKLAFRHEDGAFGSFELDNRAEGALL